ncbi:hypothetical protein HYS10_00875 [Candidatus Collierbacteria bacterium]|nr:hypothetical protein [Candidatus Collierbacteria bacterium]
MSSSEFFSGAIDELDDEFEGCDLEQLEVQAQIYYDGLMQEELGDDEDVFRDVLSLLVIQRSIYKLRIKEARDLHERAAFENLAWKYEAMLRAPESVGQHAYTYCSDECDCCYQIGMKFESRRWEVISQAVERIVFEIGKVW